MIDMLTKLKPLFAKSWDSYSEKVFEVVSSNEEAELLINELLSINGWRERVAAIKIITAFKLKSYTPDLIKSFCSAPDFYTCIALTKLISILHGKSGLDLLLKMQEACLNKSQSNDMQLKIESAINEINEP